MNAFMQLQQQRSKLAQRSQRYAKSTKAVSTSQNLLIQDKNIVRQTGHSFMFGTGMSMNNVRNIELPQIQSPKAPAGASTSPTENGPPETTEALQDTNNPLRKEWEIMDKVLKAQKIKQAQSLVEPENTSPLQKRSISPIRRSLEPIKEEPFANTSPRKQNNSSKLGLTKQTSEEKQIKIREFVNKARLQDIKEIPMDSLGFEVNKIDYSSFRRNYGSLIQREQMLKEKKMIRD